MTVISGVFTKKRELWFPSEYPNANPVNCRNNLDMCVIYILWGEMDHYIQCLYLSLVSQQKYTDIESADVKVFASSSQFELAKKILAPFQIDIIEIDEWFSEAAVLTHPKLNKYKHIVKLDSDVFFSGRRANLYKALFNLDIQSIGMYPDLARPRTGLQIHYQYLTISKDSFPKYLQGYARSMGISDKEIASRIDNTPWHLGCIHIVAAKFLKKEAWRKLMEHCRKIECISIETIMLLYAHRHVVDLDVLLKEGIKFSVGNPSIELFREDCDWLKVVHPARNGRADYRILDKIAEEIRIDPNDIKNVSPKRAEYVRPIHIGYIEGIEGSRFSKLKPTSKIRILCVGCSFINLRFGWPYFLSKILPKTYEVVDLGRTGAGIEMFFNISDLLKSYEPDFVVVNGTDPRRMFTTKRDKRDYDILVESLTEDDMSLEEECSIRMTAWLVFRKGSLSGQLSQKVLHKNENILKRFKELFDCPVISMTNEYDYPYYGQFSSQLRNQFDLITSFRGIEYSTYSYIRRDAVWHPSVKRAKEEAELLANYIVSLKSQ